MTPLKAYVFWRQVLPLLENTACSPLWLPPTSSRSRTTWGAMFCRMAHGSRPVGIFCSALLSMFVATLVWVTSTGLVSLVSLPAFATIALVPDTIVIVLYGPKWIAAMPLLPQLALAMPALMLSGVASALLASMGRPGRDLFVQATTTGLLVAGVLVGHEMRTHLEPSRFLALQGFWEVAAFVINVWLFLLVGIQLSGDMLVREAWPILLAVVALHAGRAVCEVHVLSDGRLRMREHFHWTTRPGTGTNEFEEVEVESA